MITELLYVFTIVPSQLLCLFPMRNQLRFSMRRTLCLLAALDCLLFPAAAFFIFRYSIGINAAVFTLFLIFYAAYQFCLRCPACKSLSVLFAVCALTSIQSNITCAIESRIAPDSGADILTVDAALIQLTLGIIAAGLLFYPTWKYGAELVDALDISRIWYMTLPFCTVILGINLVNRPMKYQTLFVNNVFRAFLISIVSTMLLWVLLCVMFYHIVTTITTSADQKMKIQLLEMQESQFHAQQRYIEASSRARHDFRQSVLTMKNLCHEGNYHALEQFIDKYFDALPQVEIRRYCRNQALNALLNYYAGKAGEEKIQLSLRIDLPEVMEISDVDLCSVAGNILENAINACLKVSEDRRQIRLTMIVKNGNRLYLVATNSYDGNIRWRDGRYLSTQRQGEGTGLKSIAETAAKYKGKAEFSHDDSSFYSNVMLPVFAETSSPAG